MLPQGYVLIRFSPTWYMCSVMKVTDRQMHSNGRGIPRTVQAVEEKVEESVLQSRRPVKPTFSAGRNSRIG